MKNITKRILLFLFGCIVVRSLLAYAAYKIPLKYLPYMGYLALIPAIGFLYLYFADKRKTGPEVFGDKIWWSNLRIIHGTLYIIFAKYAIQQRPYAYILLVIDVIFGLSAFLFHHFF